MYTTLCSAILFPLHEFLKGHSSVAMRRSLEESQWYEPSALAELQRESLTRFIGAIGSNVPYYRRVFADVGFNPANLNGPEGLRRLPFLTKSIIRQNSASLRADGATPLTKYNTGGSSGEPLVFYMGADRISHDVAAKWRATRWWDVDIGDPEVVLWGSPVELGKQDRLKAARDRLFRSHLFPAFQMSPSQMDHYLHRLDEIRPRMLFGYASAIHLLAVHAKNQGHRIRNDRLKVVFTTGETLYPTQREVIESVFGAPVANGYGSRDGGFIAHECPAGSLHVSTEDIVVEIVDSAGRVVEPGQSGEIVVTHLRTVQFPFLRYRTGDVGALGTKRCSCGRGLQVLENVQGRSTDFVVSRSGNVMHALALIYILRDKPGVAAFKIIQAEDHSIEVRIATHSEFTAETASIIKAELERRLGDETNVSVVVVDEIPPEKSGKYRYVESRVTAR